MSSRPRCPNHKCEMNKTDNMRIWICPQSGARFECDVNAGSGKKRQVITAGGQLVEVTDYEMKPLDGQGG